MATKILTKIPYPSSKPAVENLSTALRALQALPVLRGLQVLRD